MKSHWKGNTAEEFLLWATTVFTTICQLLYPLNSLLSSAAEVKFNFVSVLWSGDIGTQSFHNVLMNWNANLAMGLPASLASHQNNAMPVDE